MSEEIQYDAFPPFCKLKMEGFSFPFNHVEIWQNGTKIDELEFNAKLLMLKKNKSPVLPSFVRQ